MIKTKLCFCVRCGRPMPLDEFINRTWGELPPYCNRCLPSIKEAVANMNTVPNWPSTWFGHAVRRVANSRAIWMIDVAHLEAQPFYTPVWNGFKEGEIKP